MRKKTRKKNHRIARDSSPATPLVSRSQREWTRRLPLIGVRQPQIRVCRLAIFKLFGRAAYGRRWRDPIVWPHSLVAASAGSNSATETFWRAMPPSRTGLRRNPSNYSLTVIRLASNSIRVRRVPSSSCSGWDRVLASSRSRRGLSCMIAPARLQQLLSAGSVWRRRCGAALATAQVPIVGNFVPRHSTSSPETCVHRG